MEILNKVFLGESCRNRRLEDVSLVVVHRSGVATSAEDMAKWYKDNPKYTGGKCPYHFFIDRRGVVSQCVQLSKIAPGAVVANKKGIMVACEGDMRYKPLAPDQALALIDLVGSLCSYIGQVMVVGHDEIIGGAEDPDKECPGKHLSMDGLRRKMVDCFVAWSDDKRAGNAHGLGLTL